MVAPPKRTPTPYPLPPQLLVDTVVELASQLPAADRVTLGMPGMIRHGIVIATPHYITKDGPRSRVVPELVTLWDHFDMAGALEKALSLPTKVLNDAEVAGAGVVTGRGLEMIITLGTGLGNAVFDGGRLAPHVEVSQGPIRWGLTYDDYIGEHERLRLGDMHWSRRVRRVVEGLRPMYMWDRLYLGGGNSKRIVPSQREKLGDDVIIVLPTDRIASKAMLMNGLSPLPVRVFNIKHCHIGSMGADLLHRQIFCRFIKVILACSLYPVTIISIEIRIAINFHDILFGIFFFQLLCQNHFHNFTGIGSLRAQKSIFD